MIRIYKAIFYCIVYSVGVVSYVNYSTVDLYYAVESVLHKTMATIILDRLYVY
jgi:hypothetical protein